jgi:hypothetical protein
LGLPYTVAVRGLLVGGGIILLLAFNVTHLYLWISMLNDLSGQLPEGLQLATRWDPFARWRFRRAVLRLHREHFPASPKREYWYACWGIGYAGVALIVVRYFLR